MAAASVPAFTRPAGSPIASNVADRPRDPNLTLVASTHSATYKLLNNVLSLWVNHANREISQIIVKLFKCRGPPRPSALMEDEEAPPALMEDVEAFEEMSFEELVDFVNLNGPDSLP